MKYLVNLDLNKNELQNAVIQPLASAPSNPREGQIYYNSTDKLIYRYDGSNWAIVGANDVVKYTAQSLTDEQKEQARTNISAQVAITGAASTVTTTDLATSRALISNSSGKIAVSDVTSTELGYLDGVTSAIQTQLNGKQATISDLATIRSGAALGATSLQTSQKGANNGVAELDANGKVPSSQLPSYVDDVLEYASQSDFPATGETGKIYIAKDTNKTYRWGGSAYVEISASLALGETDSTAYRGDRGKTAYDHSQINNGSNPHGTTFANIASKPTTISGYGITDAKIASGVVTLGSNTITPVTSVNTKTGSSVTLTQDDIGDGTTYKQYSATEKSKLSGIDSGATANTITLNGTATKTPSFYAPTSAGTSGQVLVSNGSGAPTWQAAPETAHKYTATNSTLTASGGAWTWTVTAATHGINNNAMFTSLYEVSSGAQVMADITVNPTTYDITVTIIGIGSLAAGTYRLVALG